VSFGLRTAYRLVIAGCPLEAVTDPAMERASTDGRQRVRGLRRDGLRLEDESDIATATIEASGVTFSIVDRQRDVAWTEALTRHPRVVTTLGDEGIAATGIASFAVASVEGFAVGDFIHVGTECMEITGRVTSPPRFTCSRAHRDTTAQRHFVSTNELDFAFPEVLLEHPRSLEGRRVFLFRYVEGVDDFQGNGRPIWRGVITSDAELAADGATWSIQADPVTALWEIDLGAQLEEEFSITGITYTGAAPFRMQLSEMGGTGVLADVEFVGHFADQEAFVARLNTELAASIASLGTAAQWASGPTADIVSDGRWGLRWTARASSPRWLEVTTTEGALLLDGQVDRPDRLTRALYRSSVNPTPGASYTYVAGLLDRGRDRVLATVPRAAWGGSGVDAYAVAPALYPGVIYYLGSRRVQLDPTFDVGLSLTYEGIARDLGVEEVSPSLNSSNFSTTEPRYVEARSFPGEPVAWINGSLPKFRIRSLLLRGDATSGDLDHLRRALVQLGPAEANAGNAPFVVPQDFTLWTETVAEAIDGRGAFFSRRRLEQTQAAELGDVLANEAQLLGCFFRLDDRGAIDLKRILQLTAQLIPAARLGPDTILANRPARWQRAPFGFFTEGELKTGYDTDEDDYTGATFRVRSRESMSSRKLPKELVVEPISSAAAGPPGQLEGAELAAQVFAPTFALLGQPYAVVEVTVPSVAPGGDGTDLMATCLVGEIISITSHRIPNAQGGRGVTDARALIISRDWDLRNEQGTLRCIISEAPVAGYTPSVRGTAVLSGDGTTTQTLAVDFLDPFTGSVSLAPDGAELSDFFAVDDRVEHLEVDATTQTPRPGTVTAVDDVGGTLTVQLDAAATLATGLAQLRFASADDAGLTELQRGFSFWGDSRGYVQDGAGGDAIAKRFA